MHLKTIIRALAKQYENNDELTNIQTLVTILQDLAKEINITANDLEEVYRRVAAGEHHITIKHIQIEREQQEHKQQLERHRQERHKQEQLTNNQ